MSAARRRKIAWRSPTSMRGHDPSLYARRAARTARSTMVASDSSSSLTVRSSAGLTTGSTWQPRAASGAWSMKAVMRLGTTNSLERVEFIMSSECCYERPPLYVLLLYVLVIGYMSKLATLASASGDAREYGRA